MDERAGGSGGEPGPPAHPSRLVELELAVLAADTGASQRASVERHASHSGRTALIVTSDRELSRYVAECVDTHADLRAVVAESVAAGFDMALARPPQLAIVDTECMQLLESVHGVPTLILADETARVIGVQSAMVLVRPFNTRSLLDAVDRLLTAP